MFEPFAKLTATGARLADIGWIAVPRDDAHGLRLAFGEGLQLLSGPAMRPAAHSFPCLDAGANVCQVFHRDFANARFVVGQASVALPAQHRVGASVQAADAIPQPMRAHKRDKAIASVRVSGSRTGKRRRVSWRHVKPDRGCAHGNISPRGLLRNPVIPPLTKVRGSLARIP